MNRAAWIGDCLRFVLCWKVLYKNLLIALTVGTILTAANQYDVLARDPMSARLAVKILFNFAVPFVVSSVSAVVNRKAS